METICITDTKNGYKSIIGFRRYEINREGIVRRKKTNNKEAKVIVQGFNKYYYHVTLVSDDNISKTIDTHKLVALTFIPNPDNLPCINHKDEDKTNNKVKNLEWCNQLYNVNYGSSKDKISKANSKKIYRYDVEGNKEEYDSIGELANVLNITIANISSCIKYMYLINNKYIVSKTELDSDTISYIFDFRSIRKKSKMEILKFKYTLEDKGIKISVRNR